MGSFYHSSAKIPISSLPKWTLQPMTCLLPMKSEGRSGCCDITCWCMSLSLSDLGPGTEEMKEPHREGCEGCQAIAR